MNQKKRERMEGALHRRLRDVASHRLAAQVHRQEAKNAPKAGDEKDFWQKSHESAAAASDNAADKAQQECDTLSRKLGKTFA